MVFQYNPLDYLIETNDGRRARHHRLPRRDDRAEDPLQPARSRLASSASARSSALLARLGCDRPTSRPSGTSTFRCSSTTAAPTRRVAFYGANIAPAGRRGGAPTRCPSSRERVALVRAPRRRGRGGEQDACRSPFELARRRRERRRTPSASRSSLPRPPGRGQPGLPRGGAFHPVGLRADARVPRRGRPGRSTATTCASSARTSTPRSPPHRR